MSFDLLSAALRDGLIWFPLVLGLGFVYTKLREVDVSCEGIITLAGLGVATVWNHTHSHLCSVLAGLILGALLGGLVGVLAWVFRLGLLMAGIAFSIASQAGAVLAVGESLTVQDSSLFSGFVNTPAWLIATVLVVGLGFESLLHTSIGVEMRRAGEGVELNHRRSPTGLKVLAMSLAGAGYGLSASLLVHAEGLARSGSGFDHLLVGTCTYLCAHRCMEWMIAGGGLKGSAAAVSSRPSQISSIVTGSVALLALIGAPLFQGFILIIMIYSPHPSAWKLIMGLTLLAILAKPSLNALRLGQPRCLASNDPNECSVDSVTFAHRVDLAELTIFHHASIVFPRGLNIVRGSNGSGKSTLLRLLAGSLIPSEGSIKPTAATNFFLLPQRLSETLAPHLTVLDNLAALVPSVDNTPLFTSSSVLSALLKRRLDEHHLPHLLNSTSGSTDGLMLTTVDDPLWHTSCNLLSGGQALMVALYGALLSQRPILLLDEPTTGLDEENFNKLTAILTALAASRIIIATTHDERLNQLNPRSYLITSNSIIKE
jgi:ABC-type Mn2+/Zn2+ transport system ATPase subunit/ABC-type uncharacterized transport system permease subunit